MILFNTLNSFRK